MREDLDVRPQAPKTPWPLEPTSHESQVEYEGMMKTVK